MAETTEKVKKAKAAAKPRATTAAPKKAEAKTTAAKRPVAAKTIAAKKPVAEKQEQTVAEKVKAAMPTHHEIAELARQYWEKRGYHHGEDEQDWLRAERELLKAS